MKKLFFILLSVILSLVLLFNTIISLAKANTVIIVNGNEYDISLYNHTDYTWVYYVAELNEAKDLSHFVLGFCEGIIVSTDPPNDDIGVDPTTQLYGVKWNTPGDFTSGYFTVTVDNLYAESLIPVAVKTGTMTGTINIIGPSCEVLEESTVTPTNTNTNTPTNTVTVEPVYTATNADTSIPTNTEVAEIPIENTPIPTSTMTNTPLPDVIMIEVTATPTNTIIVDGPTDLEETPEPVNIRFIKKVYLPITKQ